MKDGNGSDKEDTIPILDILYSDMEEVHTDVACKKARQSDAVYTSWQNAQIHQGHLEIEQCDKTVCDHPLPGKHCEAPDQVEPPISYMKECGVFKPTGFINNPMGLCRFYRMSPEKSNVLTGPKSADCIRKIYRMVEIARGMGRQLTIVVFDGESVSPTCLLGQLHSRASLLQMAIHTD